MRELKANLEAAQTLSELAACSDILFLNVRFNSIECLCCTKFGPRSGLAGSATQPGIIEGTAKKSLVSEERPLWRVRAKLFEHLIGRMHDHCLRVHQEEQRIFNERTSIGITIGREVLSNIKEHESDYAIERRLALEAQKGTSIGTKNHGRKLVPLLRNAMHSTLCDSFARLLITPDPITGRPPPFALMADKATIRRETGQMSGLITMIGGKLTAIFLAVLPAPDSTGSGLAGDLVKVLTGGLPLSLDPSLLTESFTCFAADGQYQSRHEGHASGLAVQQHLCSLLHLNPSFCLSRWDGAHRIELGMDAVRASEPFYHDMATKIAKAYSAYLHGKNYDRIKAAAGTLNVKLAAVNAVCTTRFCQSEQKVYLNFSHNLIVLIEDLERERKADEARTIKNVTFVTQLFGIIDLLSHVKDISLYLQSVEVLPWEAEDTVRTFLQLMTDLAADLAQGKTDRMLPPTPRSEGKRVPAFKYLSRHMSELKQGKLSMDDDTGGRKTIDLHIGRQGRSADSGGGSLASTRVSEVLTKDLASMAKKIFERLSERLSPPDDEAGYLLAMQKSLDVREMIKDSGYAQRARPHLQKLYDWLQSRRLPSAAPPSASFRPMPAFDVVWSQYGTFATNLYQASRRPAFQHWTGKSGTVIIADVWSDSAASRLACLAVGVGDFLYLLQHMATKTMCEAVIEGMGGMWSACSSDVRHLTMKAAAQEAVVCWSAPPPWHPAAVPFVNHSLNRMVGKDQNGAQKDWNFTHRGDDRHHGQLSLVGTSRVVRRLKQVQPRLPAALYD